MVAVSLNGSNYSFRNRILLYRYSDYHQSSKLTDEDVFLIRALYSESVTTGEIADKFDVSPRLVRHICYCDSPRKCVADYYLAAERFKYIPFRKSWSSCTALCRASGMEGRAFWFHVMQLLNGRYQRELSENHVTAQRASCQTAFKRAVIETNGARRESYRRLCGWLMELMAGSVLVRIWCGFQAVFHHISLQCV